MIRSVLFQNVQHCTVRVCQDQQGLHSFSQQGLQTHDQEAALVAALRLVISVKLSRYTVLKQLELLCLTRRVLALSH